MFFVSSKLLFWFLQCSNFRKKLKILKWNNYDIMKWIAHITNFNYWKNFFEWQGDGPLKKKTSGQSYLTFLKEIPGTF